MTSKNEEIVVCGVKSVLERGHEFNEAITEGDVKKMVVLFLESQNMCVSLLADICEDSDTKLDLIEAGLVCKENIALS